MDERAVSIIIRAADTGFSWLHFVIYCVIIQGLTFVASQRGQAVMFLMKNLTKLIQNDKAILIQQCETVTVTPGFEKQNLMTHVDILHNSAIF